MSLARAIRSAFSAQKVFDPRGDDVRIARSPDSQSLNAVSTRIAVGSGMTSQTDLFRFGLAALLTGVAIPLALQLFLVLRNVQKATATLDRRLDETLRDVGDVVAELKRVSVPAPSLASQLVAALPAVIAGVHAFRSGMARTDSSDTSSSNHHTKENAA
jgi:hypothetical protein